MTTANRRGGFLLPLVIVAVGIVLLLNNLNILSWGVWEDLARLWPALLILGGATLLWRQWRGG
jgi:hypothetical protein